MFPEENGIYTGYMESTANAQYNSNNPKSNPIETFRPSPPKSPVIPTRNSDHEPLPLPKRRRPRPALLVQSTQAYLHDDAGIQELFPATNEPSDLPLPPSPAFSAPTAILQANPSQMVSTEQHRGHLEQLDGCMHGADVSYKDYGGYDTA